MTCEKVAKNGPNLKKLAKKNQIGENDSERNPSRNPEFIKFRGPADVNALENHV